MPVYQIIKDKLQIVKEKKIDLEKDIQALVEKNIGEVLGLTLVKSEFPLNSLRIDTLAFDEGSKSFVIIEYKKDKNFSVIDQGYAYLALLLNNKADFVLEYNERLQKNLKKSEIDWSQSRVIFISSAFTKFQKEAMGFRDLPIELREVKVYENDLLTFNEINAPEKNESITVVAKGQNAEVVNKEVKTYTVEGLFKPGWEKTKALYEQLQQAVLELEPNFEVRPVKYYVGFFINGKSLLNVTPQSEKVLLELLKTQPEDLKDPEKGVSYRVNSYKYFGQHISKFYISNDDDVEYAMMLIRQVYKKFLQA